MFWYYTYFFKYFSYFIEKNKTSKVFFTGLSKPDEAKPGKPINWQNAFSWPIYSAGKDDFFHACEQEN